MRDDLHHEPESSAVDEREPAVARDPRFLRGVERRAAGEEAVERAGPGLRGTEAGTAPELAGDVLPFRRTAVKPRRKRRNPWLRLLRPLATAVLVVALPTSLTGWVLTSPRFALADLQVTGTAQVERDWVEQRLEGLRGRNLVQLPLAEVEQRLAGHPWIEGVAIRKQLPAALEVEVRERRAAALVPAPTAAGAAAGAGSLWLADAAGRPIVPAPAGAEDDFVVVIPAPERGSAAGPLADAVPGALSVAADLARFRPVWAAALDRVEALGEDEYRVVTAALPFPLLVRSGELEPRAGYLEAALPELRRRHGEIAVADLRFADRLVVRPSGAPALETEGAISTGATTAMQRTGPAAPSQDDDMRREVG